MARLGAGVVVAAAQPVVAQQHVTTGPAEVRRAGMGLVAGVSARIGMAHHSRRGCCGGSRGIPVVVAVAAGDPALNVPAQRHLRGRLPVSLPDPGKRRMGEDTVLPLRQGAPRLGTHPFANPAAKPKLE